MKKPIPILVFLVFQFLSCAAAAVTLLLAITRIFNPLAAEHLVLNSNIGVIPMLIVLFLVSGIGFFTTLKGSKTGWYFNIAYGVVYALSALLSQEMLKVGLGLALLFLAFSAKTKDYYGIVKKDSDVSV